jgi:hypothetical protein
MVNRRVQTLLDQLRAQGITDEHVLEAISLVPREKFIDEAFEHKAWDNVALPIGQGQTISQPYMVARMTALLELTPQSGCWKSARGLVIRLRYWRIWCITFVRLNALKVCNGTHDAALNNLIYIMFQLDMAMAGRVGRRAVHLMPLLSQPHRQKFRRH